MESLKILLLTTEYPPGILAGSGMYVVNLIEGLRQHEVTVITPYTGAGKTQERFGNVEIRRIKTLISPSTSGRSFIDRSILFGMALRNYLKKTNLSKYDILHSISLPETSFLDMDYIAIVG